MSKLQLVVTGHVGQNVKHDTVGDKKVCNFSVAHSVGKDEDKKTVWIEYAAWGRRAEICEAIELKTGDKITVFSEWLTPNAYLKGGEAVGKIKAYVDHIEK